MVTIGSMGNRGRLSSDDLVHALLFSWCYRLFGVRGVPRSVAVRTHSSSAVCEPPGFLPLAETRVPGAGGNRVSSKGMYPLPFASRIAAFAGPGLFGVPG